MPLRSREEDESVFFVHYPLFRATFEEVANTAPCTMRCSSGIINVVITFTSKSTPLPANARVLERPQGAQRRLLCCGETPDVGDIESLVGSIPPQSAQMLAIVQVPEHDGPVIPATGQPAAIGAHLERLQRSLMRLSHPQKATRLSAYESCTITFEFNSLQFTTELWPAFV